MRLKFVASSVECSHNVLQAFASSMPSSYLTLHPSTKKHEIDRTSSLSFLANSFVSKNLLKSHTINKISRGHRIQRSCSSNLDEIYQEPPFHRVEGLTKSSGQADSVQCALSKRSPFTGVRGSEQDFFFNSRFDLLEPMMLGISPDFPDRPDQETVMWTTIEQKAKSCDIPLSLRMIKKKLQSQEGYIESEEGVSCSLKAAFASTVFTIVELQSNALQMREAFCREDLEIIISKVQKEMHSSFVWLFQQVFSRTPDLMLHVMTLLANFSVHSVSHNVAFAEASLSRAVSELAVDQSSFAEKQSDGSTGEKTKISDLPESSRHPSNYPADQLESKEETNLWNFMVDEAIKMQEVAREEVLDHDSMKHFVSPVSVEIEPDDYEDYLRTDLLYQMYLSYEPNNPLLLCNYAQFLHLVAHDYDRAEECFKRAVQITPPDAESLSQYANFLWTVRKDFMGAEERFLQVLAAEPENSYYASRYANFLWSTGGEETCFPLNNSHNPNS